MVPHETWWNVLFYDWYFPLVANGFVLIFWGYE